MLSPFVLILDEAVDVLGHEPYDRVDDSLLLEVVVAATPVAIPMGVIPMPPIALAPPMLLDATPISVLGPNEAFEGRQPFEDFTPVVVTHG
jgi:hypothetical protein